MVPLSGRTLYRQVILHTPTSRQLATSIAAVSLARPTGSLSCPNDNGSASALAFAYPGRQDVDLWYHDSGRATLDNGKVAAIIDGNPPFYQGFAPLLDRLAPPE
jgi:precorrin-2 methylase